MTVGRRGGRFFMQAALAQKQRRAAICGSRCRSSLPSAVPAASARSHLRCAGAGAVFGVAWMLNACVR